jgi:hypothetical protein
MQIDPVDDCTFWYTNEFYAGSSNKEWSTKVAAFSFPGCPGSAPAPDPAPSGGGSSGETPTPAPSPTVTKPPPGPTPYPGPAVNPPALQTATGATRFAPGEPIRLRFSSAQPGCRVTFTLGSERQTTFVDNTGTAAVTMAAPNRNRAYTATVTQFGTGCAAVESAVYLSVSGPYLTGPSRGKVGQNVTITGHALQPGHKLTWRVSKSGRTVDTSTERASGRGTATYAVELTKKGSYTVTLDQGGQRLRTKVTAR